MRIVPLTLDQIENVKKGGYYVLCLVQIEKVQNEGYILLFLGSIKKVFKGGLKRENEKARKREK